VRWLLSQLLRTPGPGGHRRRRSGSARVRVWHGRRPARHLRAGRGSRAARAGSGPSVPRP